MVATRLFVANLTTNTKEKDLRSIFEEFFTVNQIELKCKESSIGDAAKTIAFVTVESNPDDLDYYIGELNWRKVNGIPLKVSIAKESFLERLKREREEAGTEVKPETFANESGLRAESHTSNLFTQTLQNTRKKFTDEDLNGDDIAPELLITKKRASRSLQNGKIVIESYDHSPIHVIEKKKSIKHLDEKSTSADQKRKESLNKMKYDYQQKKSTIQQALSNLDASTSKKIKFSDSEDEDTIKENATKSKTNIFGSDDGASDNEDNHLNLLPEHFGKKGERLIQMQSKQSLDPRFKIDAKFVDNDNYDDRNDMVEGGGSEAIQQDNERDWQMGILEQVIGSRIEPSTSQKSNKNKKMLRYDPSKEEHKKLLRKTETTTSKQLSKEAEEEDEERSAEHQSQEVSKDVFYVVTDTLKESLKTRGEGFSLLNMFNKSEEANDREDQLKNVSNEKILINKSDKHALRPFHYDSSSDSDSDLDFNLAGKDADDYLKVEKQIVKKHNSKQIYADRFFFLKRDYRLQEGVKFFKYENKELDKNYEIMRNKLKLLIKKKMVRSQRNSQRSQRRER